MIKDGNGNASGPEVRSYHLDASWSSLVGTVGDQAKTVNRKVLAASVFSNQRHGETHTVKMVK